MTRTCSTCGTPLGAGAQFCGSCGAAAPADTPAAGIPAPPPPPQDQDPTLIAAPQTPDEYGTPVYEAPSYATSTPEPGRPKAGRRIVVIAAIVAGVAALGVAGGILLRSGGGATGADTPDAAVRRLVAAVTDRDVIGAFEATAPDELRGAGDIYKASVDKSRALGMLGSGDPMGGVTLNVSGLDMAVTTISDDLARVTIGAGTLAYKIDPKGFPVGEKYKEDFEAALQSAEPQELEGSVDLAKDTGEGPPVLYTVKRGGKWYVSLYSTITHYLGFDPATTASADPNRKAAATPEEALMNLMEGGARLDPDAVLDAIAPAEARIARIYESYIRDAFEEGRNSGVSVKISSPDMETDPIDGSRAKVWINRVTADVDMPEQGSVRVQLDGSCASMTAGGETERYCLSDAGIDEYLHLLPNRAFAVAVKDDKGWYISTVETMFELIRHTISALKQSDIDALMNAISSGNFE